MAVIAACTGCRQPSPQNGAALFRKDCGGCHVRRPGQQNFAPALDGYFDRQPRPSERQARRIIQEGKGYMPPFRDRLSAQELDDLMSYMKTRP